MKKEEFDRLFSKAKTQLLPHSEEEIVKMFSQYTKDPKHFTMEEIAVAVWMESIKYTNDLVYALLLEAAVEKD